MTNETGYPLELIALNVKATSKAEAIDAAADVLVRAGAIEPAYAASMQARELVANTCLGQGVAIPHGQVQDRHLVLQDRIAVLQIPQGVDWGEGNQVRLVFGIAARGDGHLAVLRRITRLLHNQEQLARLCTTADKADIAQVLADMAEGSTAAAATGTDLAECQSWTVDYPNGLHARPASLWLQAAQGDDDTRLQVRNTRTGLVSDLSSLVSLLHIDARLGDELVFSAAGASGASGASGRHRLQQLLTQVQALSQEEKAVAHSQAAATHALQTAHGWQPPVCRQALRGVAASPGLCVGRVVRVHTGALERPEIPDTPEPLAQAAARLQSAIDTAQQQLTALMDDVQRRVGASEATIFQSHAQILRDESLIATTSHCLLQGHGLAWSWQRAVTEICTRLQAEDNPMLAERAADVRDVGQRVLAHIAPQLASLGLAAALERQPAEANDLIVLADDLSPSDTASLDTTRVRALVTALGGPSGHTAILARTLGLPAIVALGEALQQVQDGEQVIVDGSSGTLWLAPGAPDVQAAQAKIRDIDSQRQQQAQQRQLPAMTQDGSQIAIAANINQPQQAALALDCGAEGVGLMRTEFLFLDKGSSPSEDEQYATYCAMLDALQGKPLIVRALDIGGDKQVAHLKLPREDNPFLGVRGIRLLLRRPDLLEPQLRALYRAAKDRQAEARLSIMFPMVSTLGEVRQFKHMAETIRHALDAPSVALGIMIEVPAAALLAGQLAEHVDFFSIGTNDLTQYTLAMDRQNPLLAAEVDSLHPAVLRMVQATVQGARQYGRWVGVCGGLAGDPFGAGILAGLGVHELSMTPRDIAAVKTWLRAQHMEQLQALAHKALTLESAAQVRALQEEGAA